MKLVFTDPPLALLPNAVQKISALPGVEATSYGTFAIDEEELYHRGKHANVIITDLTRYNAVLRRWPNLHTIITSSVGTDHIDVGYCQHKGIRIVNFPGYNCRAVAEMSIAILVSLLRKVPAAQEHALTMGWEFEFFEGRELEGKTFGVIGAGNVGREIIKIAQGFGMKVVAHTKHPSDARAQSIGITGFHSLRTVLEQADFLIITVPYTAATYHMLGTEQFKLMKPTAFLVNTGRGPVIDTLALAKALYEGLLAGAALDVIENEPFSIYAADPRIQEMVNAKNVILTPHISFNTRESAERLEQRIVETVRTISA